MSGRIPLKTSWDAFSVIFHKVINPPQNLQNVSCIWINAKKKMGKVQNFPCLHFRCLNGTSKRRVIFPDFWLAGKICIEFFWWSFGCCWWTPTSCLGSLNRESLFYEPQTSCARCVCGVHTIFANVNSNKAGLVPCTLLMLLWVCKAQKNIQSGSRKWPLGFCNLALLSLCTYNLLLNRIRNWSCSYPYRALINMEWEFF